MKLLLDQGLPRSAVRHLAEMGLAAEHVGDLGMATATDADILEAARQRQAVVVTLDSDFHALLATSRAVSPSVVRIRIEGLKGEPLAAILQSVLNTAVDRQPVPTAPLPSLPCPNHPTNSTVHAPPLPGGTYSNRF